MSLDSFEFNGQHFIMVLDISTKFFVVRPVSSLNTDHNIQTLTSVFSEHGMPISIKCNHGRNCVSDLFQQYCQHLGITLSFSSAYHHSGNLAERAIRTIKGLMKHCTMAKQSWCLALWEYLSTPLDNNTPSQSELNGCHFTCLLQICQNPTLSECLDTMLSFNEIKGAMYCQSCLLAVQWVIVIMLQINFVLVLFQIEMPGHIQLLQKMVLT